MTSKKLYIAVAQELKPLIEDCEGDEAYAVLHLVVKRLAAVFKADNPNFNETTFAKACGTWCE